MALIPLFYLFFEWPLKTGFTVCFLFLFENAFCGAYWIWITSKLLVVIGTP